MGLSVGFAGMPDHDESGASAHGQRVIHDAACGEALAPAIQGVAGKLAVNHGPADLAGLAGSGVVPAATIADGGRGDK